MHSNPCRAEIIGALCELSSRYQFPEKSAFIAAEAGAYRSPRDPQRAIEALVRDFGEAALVEAGIAVPSRDGPLQLVPALASPDTPFVVLNGNEDGRPFGLVFSEGCLGHQSPPLFAGLQDRFTASNLRKSQLGYLCVCATIEDMILLQSLGFAATTAAGLSELKMQDVRALGRHFGIAFSPADEDADNDDAEAIAVADPPAEALATTASGPDSTQRSGAEAAGNGSLSDGTDDQDEFTWEGLEIVLVAWSPSRWEQGVPCCIAAAEKYFSALSESFGLLLNLTTWLPTDADIAEMEFVIAHKSKPWLRKKMLASVQRSRYSPLNGKLPQAPTPPLDYADAVGRLLGPAAEDKAMLPARAKPHELWQTAQELLERDVIRPLMDQALRTPDRIERTLTLGLAELSRVFHTQGLLLGRKLSQGAATPGVDGLSPVPQDEIRQCIALAARMQGMAAEIYRHRESALTGVIECQVISQPSSQRLLGSR